MYNKGFGDYSGSHASGGRQSRATIIDDDNKIDYV